MAKGYIVVEVPEKDCRGCQCFGTYNSCGAVQKFVDPIAGRTPDWCPIRPFPNVRNEDKAYTDCEYYRDQGYNTCIEELLEGVDEDNLSFY